MTVVSSPPGSTLPSQRSPCLWTQPQGPSSPLTLCPSSAVSFPGGESRSRLARRQHPPLGPRSLSGAPAGLLSSAHELSATHPPSPLGIASPPRPHPGPAGTASNWGEEGTPGEGIPQSVSGWELETETAAPLARVIPPESPASLGRSGRTPAWDAGGSLLSAWRQAVSRRGSWCSNVGKPRGRAGEPRTSPGHGARSRDQSRAGRGVPLAPGTGGRWTHGTCRGRTRLQPQLEVGSRLRRRRNAGAGGGEPRGQGVGRDCAKGGRRSCFLKKTSIQPASTPTRPWRCLWSRWAGSARAAPSRGHGMRG